MTYDAREKSAADGRPIEIYSFARGSLTWRYTSADTDQVVETQNYRAVVIRRPNIQQGPEVARSVLSLVVSKNLDVLDQYRVVPPSDEVTLLIRQFHVGDGEYKAIWNGVIADVKFLQTEAAIVVEPRSNGLRRMGLRRIYQRQCPHLLYGPGCNLNAADFRVTGTVATVAGTVLTVPAADVPADGHFNGGYIEWQIGVGVFERRFIESHVGSSITISVQTVGLVAGMEVRLYPGCDRSLTTCNAKFSNVLNFGGMPYIPLKNPFGSDPVY